MSEGLYTDPRPDQPAQEGPWARRPGAGWVPPLLAALTFVLVYVVLEGRGANTWGLWLVEAVDRVQPWLGDPDMWGAEAIERAWAGHSALPPLTLLATALLKAIWPGLGTFQAAHLVSAVAVSLTVPLVWGLGRRAGGAPAGAGAVLAFVTTPRVLAAATTAGFDAAAIFGVTFAIYALYRARTSALWTPAAAVALAIAPLTTHVGVLLLIPWVLLTLSDKGQVSTLLIERGRDPGAPDGFLRAASFPPRLLITLALAPVVMFALYPWLWRAPLSRLSRYLSHFLTQPKPPFLYLGDLVGVDRLPWHAAPLLLLVTVPVMTAVLGVVGFVGEMALRPWFATRLGRWVQRHLDFTPDPEAAGPEAQEAKRWSFAALVSLLATPWLAGAPVFGVVDLIALATPFFAVFVGCTLSRLLSVTAQFVTQLTPKRDRLPFGSRLLATLVLASFGALSFTPSVIDAVTAHPYEESYYSWLIGGTQGAVQQGLHRAPYAPVPLALAYDLEARAVEQPERSAALVLPDPIAQRVLERYRAEGLVRALPRWADLYTADLLVLLHDDLNAGYYEIAPDFAQSLPPERTAVLRFEQVRLITIGVPD